MGFHDGHDTFRHRQPFHYSTDGLPQLHFHRQRRLSSALFRSPTTTSTGLPIRHIAWTASATRSPSSPTEPLRRVDRSTWTTRPSPPTSTCCATASSPSATSTTVSSFHCRPLLPHLSSIACCGVSASPAPTPFVWTSRASSTTARSPSSACETPLKHSCDAVWTTMRRRCVRAATGSR